MVSNKHIDTLNASAIALGQEVTYGFYSNITFEGFDSYGQVILKDKNGNYKKVYREIFEKNGKIINN